MDDLYREIIIERYKSPQYQGELDPHESVSRMRTHCVETRSDRFTRGLLREVTEAAFSGHGCAISQASADLLLESVIGKSLEEVSLTKEDVLDLIGIELGPVRLKCALLSLKVLKGSVYGLGEGKPKTN